MWRHLLKEGSTAVNATFQNFSPKALGGPLVVFEGNQLWNKDLITFKYGINFILFFIKIKKGQDKDCENCLF